MIHSISKLYLVLSLLLFCLIAAPSLQCMHGRRGGDEEQALMSVSDRRSHRRASSLGGEMDFDGVAGVPGIRSGRRGHRRTRSDITVVTTLPVPPATHATLHNINMRTIRIKRRQQAPWVRYCMNGVQVANVAALSICGYYLYQAYQADKQVEDDFRRANGTLTELGHVLGMVEALIKSCPEGTPYLMNGIEGFLKACNCSQP